MVGVADNASRCRVLGCPMSPLLAVIGDRRRPPLTDSLTKEFA
jgi:hypothetical protein